MCKVSVIVPIYNVEKYLSECIDSIIAQTYTNLEIILVDDGSPDNCPAICDEYAKKDDRIIVIHKSNGGLSSARNAGLDIMTGEYCCFVDSDDVINIHFVEYLLNICLSNNADISYCGYSKFISVGEIDVYSIPENDREVLVFENDEAIKNYFSGWIYPMVWNKLYKSDCFDDLRFLIVKRSEDVPMTFELLFRKYKFCGLKGCPLYYYRNAQNSIMTNPKLSIDVIDVLYRSNDIYSKICKNAEWKKTAKKFSDNAKNDFTDTVIRIRFSDKSFKTLIKEMKKCRDRLQREMFLPEAESFSEKFDCFLMKLSLRAYRLYKLIQVKIFKVKIYK